ncbi:metalloregulator ArsR/SmtB family transcription factor [Actinotalea sp. Marseille-Q4924]|uniref:helix-turn-helix transcriptional regulator n=1 Tax=Actinotalea sp. Marseille-Q4924 TaxID=2866571 RepID=UPI001CE46777|nr:helix-turn-helix domain-containing protein [Actinotalea sp. Marseille-Q4924]
MVQRTTSAARALASPSRLAILHALQRSGAPLGVDDLAAAAQVHVNTAREHLERLRVAGFVDRTVERRGTRGRPRILWLAVDRPAAATLDERFREHLLAAVLQGYGGEVGASTAAAERAGEAWAREHAERRRAPVPPAAHDVQASPPGPDAEDAAARRQLALLETHLEDLGLAPDLDADGRRVHLRDCPFLPLAQERTEMVCSVHLGVARGVLACEEGPVRAERLEPFVGPGHCVLHLSR